jgi:DNA-binding PadR family transcriptional regulator
MTRPQPVADPRSFLPLTPLAFQVLLTLAEEPRHGYAIIREVDERTDGLIKLRTGTLYTLIQRLVDEHLVEESASRPHPSEDDERRRYYEVTRLGRDVMKAEALRLRALVGHAQRKRVIGKARA